MAVQSCDQLRQKKCVPCEDGVPKLTLAETEEQIKQLEGWELTHNCQRIRKTWVVKNFATAMNFFAEVAKIAEAEGHHPDLHLQGYRNITIEIWTHAIGGLSENDFILAAKIDQVPVELKMTSSQRS